MQRPLLLKQPSVPAAIPGAAEEVLGLADSPQSRYRSSGPSSLGRRLELCLRYGHVESRQFQRTKLLPVLIRTKCCQSSRRPLLSHALFNGCFDLGRVYLASPLAESAPQLWLIMAAITNTRPP